ISKTLITTCEVPVFAGVPPSTAVSVRVITGCHILPLDLSKQSIVYWKWVPSLHLG
uniref:Uncharacterized protein n=1 Tax=Oryzias melastigma TaxID=30732 RepID=A0A3B3D260_ORYME